MSEHRLTETDMRMALLQRGHTESQVAHLLGDIKADAWDEGQAAGISFQAGGEYLENPYRGGQP